uniref:Uncharacterized protein n=1 Tax=Solanum lycopersicum TaxID=4081 RepID=A0A3Q7JVK9_SOLLC
MNIKLKIELQNSPS